MKDLFLRYIETYAGRLSIWAWNKRWNRGSQDWVKGYQKWKGEDYKYIRSLTKKKIINNEVKVGDLKKLVKKERCPHN